MPIQYILLLQDFTKGNLILLKASINSFPSPLHLGWSCNIVWPMRGKHTTHCRHRGQSSLRKVTERAVDTHPPFSAAWSEVLTAGGAGATLGPWDRQRFLRTVGQRDRRSQGPEISNRRPSVQAPDSPSGFHAMWGKTVNLIPFCNR